MYDSPRRYEGLCGAGVHVRQKSADVHEGTRHDFLRRHEREAVTAVHADSQTKQLFVSKLLQRTVDSRNLRIAWDHISTQSGDTPGADGMRSADLDDPEVWQLLRTLRQAILTDSYRLAPDRHLQIPKSSGSGHRTLAIPTVIDRTIQRAIVQAIQPYLDPLFQYTSLGYRPHKDRFQALALADQLALGAGCWFWITEDVKNAFAQVPQQRLLDIVRVYLPGENMIQLIERVVLTNSGKGLRQGGNLSPLLLNLYLHHVLDQPWAKRNRHIPLIRVADDLLVLCRNREQAQYAYEDLLNRLRPAGLPLKGSPETSIRDLSAGQSTSWLGYHLVKGNTGLQVHPEERSWKNLAKKLALIHTKPESPLRAIQTIMGWMYQLGPCLPQLDCSKTYARIKALSTTLAFTEIPSMKSIQTQLECGYLQWNRNRKHTSKEME